MDELAERMARALGLALLAVFGAALTIGAIWCVWAIWVCYMPMMFEGAPDWVLAPKFVPFAAGAVFALLVMRGWRR